MGIPDGGKNANVGVTCENKQGTSTGCSGGDNVCLTYVATYTANGAKLTDRKSVCGSDSTSGSNLETACKAAHPFSTNVDYKCNTYKCKSNNCISMSGAGNVEVSMVVLVAGVLTLMLGIL